MAKKCYLMIEDLDGQEGIQWAVEWGLEEGEQLPEDVEDLSMAQYAVWRFLMVLNNWITDDESAAARYKEYAAKGPSGVLMPQKLDS